MAIKTISQFDAAVPTDNDYILFEQNGEGKSAKFSDFSLSYEEIMASTDLSGKVSSASAIETFIQQGFNRINIFYSGSGENDFVTFENVKIGYRLSALLIGSNGGSPLFRSCALFTSGDTTTNSVSEGTISASNNGDGTSNLTFAGNIAGWSRFFLVVFSQEGVL